MRKLARVVEPTATIDMADDPDDNRVLECAVEAKSDFIVTEDKDLMRLGSYQGIPIIGPSDFLDREV